MMILLRATCVYCHHFRLKSIEVHRYACKLKLLSRGLVLEAQVIDEVGKDISALTRSMEIGEKDEDDEERSEEDDDEAIINRLIKKREKFVLGALRRVDAGTEKTTITAEERRDVVRECMKSLGRSKRCNNCGAISPSFKPEENAKVFEMSLTDKEAKYMAGRGMTRVDVYADAVGTSQQNGTAVEVVMEDSDVESESGEDVMSDVPERKKPAKSTKKRSQAYILSTAVRNHLRRLFNNEAAILALLFNVSGSSKNLTADNFFLTVIAVPPTRYRPPAREGDTIREGPQNTQLTKILNTCLRIAQLNVRREEEGSNKTSDKYQFLHQQVDAFVQLQIDVNSLVDSAASMSLSDRLSGRTPPPGIKQTLEKKEGLFRKHMMGKRVNYAARSVISPDPNIETNEIGIPPFIAEKLTFPEPVTPWNVDALRRRVINGSTYPGASHVEHDDGKITSLEFLSLERRTALANTLLTPDGQTRLTHGNTPLPTYLNKKVHRHLQDDDILLVNRQPTLHKPSIMGHRAKVLANEKTIRLHYANCHTYNADFDGDEMNVHFPQNTLARAEAYHIANTDNQYLGPTNGDPLRGLIQDHISAAVWMTKRDTFFTREEYQQLLYGSIRPEEGGGQGGRIVTLPPTIMKPRALWSGKQVVSSILSNLKPAETPGLFLNSASQVKNANWAPDEKDDTRKWRNSEEQQVIFDDGDLLCGILDKAQIGPSEYGMVHSVFEIYGPDVAGKLLSALGRLFTKYSQVRGLSCGMDDLRLTQQGRDTRKRVLAEKVGAGEEVAIEYVGLKGAYDESLFKERMEEVIRDPEKLSGLDKAMQGAGSDLTSEMYRELVPAHLVKRFPKNNMQNMTESKAKGSGNNANLISSIIGTALYSEANDRPTITRRRSSTHYGKWKIASVVSCLRHRYPCGWLRHVLLFDRHQTSRIFLLLHGRTGRFNRYRSQNFSLGLSSTLSRQTSRRYDCAIRQHSARL
jgi:DNA-directed RNA polymerase I subunit RPA1